MLLDRNFTLQIGKFEGLAPKGSPFRGAVERCVVVQGICQGILFRDYVSSTLLYSIPKGVRYDE